MLTIGLQEVKIFLALLLEKVMDEISNLEYYLWLLIDNLKELVSGASEKALSLIHSKA